ncbi:general substrate transporter [Penicillium daleae]|uniref:General substrate transporter n=1 Tax=Penicillium daleae TaxID=63821 RepID=A0AAD6G046_9EURO|nr:general substrate transporter [Penicillium daleae]KAJ5439694.1 general substrate transporter [Penicillium daleae]
MSYCTSQWDNDWPWRALVCAQWGFAIIGFIGHLFIPELPVYLIRMDRIDDARGVLNRLYSKFTDADGHFERIKINLEEAETQNKATYGESFRGTNLRRTMIAILVFLAEPMSGLGFVSNYGDFFCRRPMFLGGCTALTTLLLCMGIAGSVNTITRVTAAVGFYTLSNLAFNIGVGSNVYAIASEVPTSVLRTKTLAISLIISNAGNLKAKIGFVFGGFMIFFIVGAYFFVPEMCLRSYEELDELFMNRVSTRQFKNYVTVVEQLAAEAFSTEKKIPTVVETEV